MKITQKLVLLQYGEAGEPYMGSCLVHPDNAGKFVALDSASGGYPCSTEIQRAHDFKTVEKALAYSRAVSGFKVREVTVTYEFAVQERLRVCPHCEGSGRIREIVDHDCDYNAVWQSRNCPDCGGTGMIDS